MARSNEARSPARARPRVRYWLNREPGRGGERGSPGALEFKNCAPMRPAYVANLGCSEQHGEPSCSTPNNPVLLGASGTRSCPSNHAQDGPRRLRFFFLPRVQPIVLFLDATVQPAALDGSTAADTVYTPSCRRGLVPQRPISFWVITAGI